jgi:hypothetical protein
MLTIVQRGGATHEKPPEIVRGPASRLPWAWDGLCFGVPFNDATRDSARDLAANAAPSEWVGAPTFGKDSRGNTTAVTGPPDYFGYANNPAHNKPSTALTAYIRFRKASTATTAAAGIFAKVHNQTDTSPYDVWMIASGDVNPAGLSSHIVINGTIYWFQDGSYTTDTTTWISVFLRWASGSTPTQTVLGERGQTLSTATYGATVSGSLTYNTTDPAQPIRLNATDTPTIDSYSAAYSQAMVWSRRLSDTELQALVADPYGWYSPRRETIGLSSPYPLAFGGGEMKFGTGSGGLR